MKPSPYQTPRDSEATGAVRIPRSRLVIIAAAVIFIIGNPYPVFDVAVGGFVGVVATARNELLPSILFGYLGATVAYALNMGFIAIRTGGIIYSGTVDLSVLFSIIAIYGGLGVLLGILVSRKTAKE